MKGHSKQKIVKINRHTPLIPYPPGYMGQPLTVGLVEFYDELPDCPKEYRGLMKILLKQFALEMGCGNSKKSRDYLALISKGETVLWWHVHLNGIGFAFADINRHKVKTIFWILCNSCTTYVSVGTLSKRRDFRWGSEMIQWKVP